MKKAVLRDPHRFHLVEAEVPEIKHDEPLREIGEAFRQIEEGKHRFTKCLVEP